MTDTGAGTRQVTSVVEEWVRRVWNEGDASAIDELFVPDGTVHGINADGTDRAPMTGPADFKPFHAAMHAACDSISCELAEVIVGPDGERAMFWLKYDICHPKSEGRVNFDVMCIAVVRGGKIVDAWNVVDWSPLLIATGISPADGVQQFLTPG
jgi:ketosteroid isomerase-like protein